MVSGRSSLGSLGGHEAAAQMVAHPRHLAVRHHAFQALAAQLVGRMAENAFAFAIDQKDLTLPVGGKDYVGRHLKEQARLVDLLGEQVGKS